MRPKKTSGTLTSGDLFRARLDQILDHEHPLFRLGRQVDWAAFEREFGQLYVDKVGRPGLPIRLMVGLHYLKHAFDESDESVVARWLENGYWQDFCGFEYFQHRLPLDPSSLVRWRQRVGPEKMETLLAETVVTAQRGGLVRERHLQRVNVDTTVQEKTIAYPTDARLYHKARRALVREAKKAGIELRQSYERLGKRALVMQGRYAHARQMKRARRETKRLRLYLGRVLRDIRRKCAQPEERLAQLLALAERIWRQQRHDTGKLYSLHAPEVECIAKGKAHKKYEFGCKVSVASTSQDNWIVGIQALHGNPYDGHTLKAALEQVERITGWEAGNAYCDRGYRGVPSTLGTTAVHVGTPRRRATPRAAWRWLKRRAAVEPVIGHLKGDHRMDRNPLKGQEGDRINALLAACGYNLRKLLRAFLVFVFRLLVSLKATPGQAIGPSPTLEPSLSG